MEGLGQTWEEGAPATGSDGLIHWDPNDDGGEEPDPNETPPPDDAAMGTRLKFYDVRLSEIHAGVFLGSAVGAQKRKWLQRRGITHIINCAPMVCHNYWPDDFKYLDLWLLDGQQEDILSVAYDTVEWIDQLRAADGKVFIHCHQGVSRSTTVVELYLMWLLKTPRSDIHRKTKSIRRVAHPNTNFMVQLMLWEKRLFQEVSKPRLYRLMPQSKYMPKYIVPKTQGKCTAFAEFGASDVWIVVGTKTLWSWIGSSADETYVRACDRLIPLIKKIEKIAGHAIERVKQGEESDAFLADVRAGCVAPPKKKKVTPTTDTSAAQRSARPLAAKKKPKRVVGPPPKIPGLGLALGGIAKAGSAEKKSEAEAASYTDDSEDDSSSSSSRSDDSSEYSSRSDEDSADGNDEDDDVIDGNDPESALEHKQTENANAKDETAGDKGSEEKAEAKK